MAATGKSFLKVLGEDLKSCSGDATLNFGNLLTEKNGIIYGWNNVRGYLCCTTVRGFITKESCSPTNSSSCNDNWQILTLSQTLYFDIKHLILSPDGEKLCLYGPHGIVIVFLPRRWGTGGKYEGGKSNIICRCVVIGEEMYLKHQSVNVIKVDWSPENFSLNTIVSLSTDNKLRIYSIDKPDAPIHIQRLFEDQDTSREATALTFASAFGEVPVDFDFGPSFVDRKNASVQPMYLLQENGDVWLLLFRICHQRYFLEQKGPITMYPPSDDNYGSEYCSILCLDSSPQVLALGTCHGLIHHCITLPGEEEESFVSYDDKRSNREFSDLDNFTTQDKSDLILYVYETIQLDFSLISNDELRSSTDLEEEEETKVKLCLRKDLDNQTWYYCVSQGGLHAVELLWMKTLQECCTKDNESNFANADLAFPASVKFLLCTKPTETSKPCAIIGTFLDKRNKDIAVICLLANGELMEVTVKLENRDLAPEIDDDNEEHDTSCVFTSPIRHMKAVCKFDEHIRQILKRDSTAPLLRSGSTDQELSPEEFYQLLNRTTQIIREEYVQKLQKAMSELNRRRSMLKDQKERQLNCVKALLAGEQVFHTAEVIEDKVKKVTENMQSLFTRLEETIHQGSMMSVVLSNAEKDWGEEVNDMQRMLKKLRMRVEMTKTKNESYSLLPTEGPADKKEVDGITIQQGMKIKLHLKEQSNAIAELVDRVKSLDMNIGV